LNFKKKSRIIQFAAVGFGVLVVVYLSLSVYGANRAMEIDPLPLSASPDPFGLAYEDVSFNSLDGVVDLKGWYLPGDGDRVIIIVNGGYQNRVDDNVDTLGLTRDLIARGYNVLLFDQRGRGESGGRGLALSNTDVDIGGAVAYLEDRGCEPDNICILGFCSGAASSCIYASRHHIGALVLDGCFIDVPTMVRRQAVAYGPPDFLVRIFIPGLLIMTRLIYGYEMINPVDVVADISCPVFFIHEEYDEFITLEETRQLLEASGNPANRLWEVPGVEHSQPYRTFPVEYVGRVDGFIRGELSGVSADDIPRDDEV
jgi:pimeloyl-ACP methyl ester carboxylesterase